MDFEKLKELPQDILILISSILPPYILTLLSKNNRDRYFTQNGLVINFHKIWDERLANSWNLIEKYRVLLNMEYLRLGLTYTEKKFAEKVKVVKSELILSVDRILKTFPNIDELSGRLIVTSRNIEELGKYNTVTNRIIFVTDSDLGVELCTKYGYQNQIILANNSVIDPEGILPIKNRIIQSPDRLLSTGIEYPGLAKIWAEDITQFLEKNIILPRIRYICITVYLYQEQVEKINKMYPRAKIILNAVCYKNWTYNIYETFKDCRIAFVIVSNLQLDTLINYENRLRKENNINKITKTLLIPSRFMEGTYKKITKIFNCRTTIDL